MNNKKLVILVPGSRPKGAPLIDPLLDMVYEMFGVKTDFDSWVEDLHEYLEEKSNLSIRTFFWNGGITRTFSLNRAAKDLASLLDACVKHHDEIELFGKSLGGIVCELAIKHMKNPDKIKKLVYVSTPHRSKTVEFSNKNINIINIYSNEDYFVSMANIFLNFGMGTKLIKNAQNIELKNFKHSTFNKNLRIKLENKNINIFDFYKNILTQPTPYN